jgi:hypothetical protein
MVTIAKGLDCIIAAFSFGWTGSGSAKDAGDSLQDCDKWLDVHAFISRNAVWITVRGSQFMRGARLYLFDSRLVAM